MRTPQYWHARGVVYALLFACASLTMGCNAANDSKSDPAPIVKNGRIDVHKAPGCLCCDRWVDHLHEAKFETSTTENSDMNAFKLKRGIAAKYHSCHTAVTRQGLVIEGHVPASAIKSFLAAPPSHAIGLAVPGMPVGSPGMEMGERRDAYDVMLLLNDGSAEVYREISGQSGL